MSSFVLQRLVGCAIGLMVAAGCSGTKIADENRVYQLSTSEAINNQTALQLFKAHSSDGTLLFKSTAAKAKELFWSLNTKHSTYRYQINQRIPSPGALLSLVGTGSKSPNARTRAVGPQLEESPSADGLESLDSQTLKRLRGDRESATTDALPAGLESEWVVQRTRIMADQEAARMRLATSRRKDIVKSHPDLRVVSPFDAETAGRSFQKFSLEQRLSFVKTAQAGKSFDVDEYGADLDGQGWGPTESIYSFSWNQKQERLQIDRAFRSGDPMPSPIALQALLERVARHPTLDGKGMNIATIGHSDVINKGTRAALRADISTQSTADSSEYVRLEGDIRTFAFWRSENGRSVLGLIKALDPSLSTEGIYDKVAEVRVSMDKGFLDASQHKAGKVSFDVVLKSALHIKDLDGQRTPEFLAARESLARKELESSLEQEMVAIHKRYEWENPIKVAN